MGDVVTNHIHAVAGQIHREICDQMLSYAREAEKDLDAVIDGVTWVPGNLEAPLATQMLLEKGRPDGIVVFGVQERGETKHGEVIAHQATSKLLDLQLAHQIPMAIAIIGPN